MDDAEFREKLIGVLQDMAGGQLSGPSGLEGLAMAIAGDPRHGRLLDGLYRIAEAIETLAEAVRDHK